MPDPAARTGEIFESILTDEDREAFDEVVQFARECLGDWETSRQQVNVALLISVGDRLAYLEHREAERRALEERAADNDRDYKQVAEAFDASGLTLYEDDIPEALIYANSIKRAGEQWTAIVDALDISDTDSEPAEEIKQLIKGTEIMAAECDRLRVELREKAETTERRLAEAETELARVRGVCRRVAEKLRYIPTAKATNEFAPWQIVVECTLVLECEAAITLPAHGGAEGAGDE